jgi:hypothetical protein
VATPKNITVTAPPMQLTDGAGDEVVNGVVTDVTQSVFETTTKVGSREEVRGGVVVGQQNANDIRATGRLTMAFSVDWYTKAGPFWATQTIKAKDGTWTGPCTGVSTARGMFGPFTCWLRGTGAYEGWTYYLVATSSASAATTTGIIYEGAPPKP